MQIVQASHGECLFCPQSGTMEVSSPEWSIILCPSCASALKAVLPDAPDWRAEALSAAIKVLGESDYLVDMLKAGGFTDNARPYVNNILEAAQRLMEAAGHLGDSETTDRKGGE